MKMSGPEKEWEVKFLEKQAITSDSKCALACNVNNRRRSFTVCTDDGLCRMYASDVYSIRRGEGFLADD